MAIVVGDLDSIIQVTTAEVELPSRQDVLMRGLVDVRTFPRNKGNPLDRPKLGKLTAYDLTEGVEIANEQVYSDTDVSINPTEVGLLTILTRRTLGRAPAGFQQQCVQENKRAYGEKLEKDLLALFSGFSGGLSGANAALTFGQVGAYITQMRGASEPGPRPHYGVLHPNHTWDVRSAIMGLTTGSGLVLGTGGIIAPENPNKAMRESSIGSLLGVPMYESGLINVDSSDDAYSAVFSKYAIMLYINEEGMMDKQWNARRRAWDLVYTGEYAAVEWVDSYGRYLLADATAPTA